MFHLQKNRKNGYSIKTPKGLGVTLEAIEFPNQLLLVHIGHTIYNGECQRIVGTVESLICLSFGSIPDKVVQVIQVK